MCKQVKSREIMQMFVKYKRVHDLTALQSQSGLLQIPTRNPKRFWKAVKSLKQHKSSPVPMVTLLLNVMLTKQNVFFLPASTQPSLHAQTHANSKQTMPLLGTFFVKRKKYLPFACTRHLQS